MRNFASDINDTVIEEKVEENTLMQKYLKTAMSEQLELSLE